MFKIEKEPKFWAPVTVFTPIDDGHREDTLRVRFKVQPAETVESFNLTNGEEIREFLKVTVVGLDDILDEDDNAMPFSEELLETMLSNYAARMAMLNTYVASVTKARAGN